MSLESSYNLANIAGYILLSEVICTLPKGNKHILKGVENIEKPNNWCRN